MADLKKYSDRAEADPDFKAKLSKDANQAIKEEFDKDLPYELRCKQCNGKLSFEVEAIEDLDDADAESVAGGAFFFIFRFLH